VKHIKSCGELEINTPLYQAFFQVQIIMHASSAQRMDLSSLLAVFLPESLFLNDEIFSVSDIKL